MMLVCLIMGLVQDWQNCEPGPVRPPFEELMQMYTPDPDCRNRDRHIRYLLSLKSLPTDGDDILEYDAAIDAYVARIRHYCR